MRGGRGEAQGGTCSQGHPSEGKGCAASPPRDPSAALCCCHASQAASPNSCRHTLSKRAWVPSSSASVPASPPLPAPVPTHTLPLSSYPFTTVHLLLHIRTRCIVFVLSFLEWCPHLSCPTRVELPYVHIYMYDNLIAPCCVCNICTVGHFTNINGSKCSGEMLNVLNDNQNRSSQVLLCAAPSIRQRHFSSPPCPLHRKPVLLFFACLTPPS